MNIARLLRKIAGDNRSEMQRNGDAMFCLLGFCISGALSGFAFSQYPVHAIASLGIGAVFAVVAVLMLVGFMTNYFYDYLSSSNGSHNSQSDLDS